MFPPGLVAFLSLISAAMAFRMSSILCSESHTLGTLLKCYFRNEIAILRMMLLELKLRRMWQNPREAQEKRLRQLTSQDAKTEYGRQYRLGDIKTLEDLQAKHPLTDYEHYREFMQRLADGERGVIVGEEVERFGITTGTTGIGKLIPLVASRHPAAQFVLSVVSFPANKSFGKPSPLQRMCLLYCKPTVGQTKSGDTVAPLLFVSKKDRDVIEMSNTPAAGFQISSNFETNYIHLLFALQDKHLGIFLAPFTPVMLMAMKILEGNWEKMLDDITKGQVNANLEISDEIRRSLDTALTPNPERAAELRAQFDKGFVGIVSRVWPFIKYIWSIDVGGFREKLEKSFTKGI